MVLFVLLMTTFRNLEVFLLWPRAEIGAVDGYSVAVLPPSVMSSPWSIGHIYCPPHPEVWRMFLDASALCTNHKILYETEQLLGKTVCTAPTLHICQLLGLVTPVTPSFFEPSCSIYAHVTHPFDILPPHVTKLLLSPTPPRPILLHSCRRR